MATETARTEVTAGRNRAPDHRGPLRSAARDADDARHRGARDDALPAGQGAGELLRRLRPGGRLRRRDVGDGRRRTACASCTATSPRTSSAASSRAGSSPSTWAAQDGITRGRDGNVHFGDRTKGCVGMISMLPDMMLIATGMAMAFKLRGEARCAITWFGDGSTSRGDFHEAMNWAGVQKLPVIFVLENNQYAYSTPLDQQFAVNPVERAAAYGFPGVSADGNDPEAMFEVIRDRPRARARRRGPDADRGRDDAHARPRRARRHEVRPDREGRGVAREGPDRPPGQAPRGARRRHAGDPRRASRPRSTPPSRRRCSRRCPTATPCSTACSPTSPPCSRTATPPGRASRR